jgi:hypothetical protein
MKMKLGSVVKLASDLLGNQEGAVGVCYDVCTLADVEILSFIFENSEYDGFDDFEQKLYLNYIGECEELSSYKFVNVMKLSDDFRNGKFNCLFKRLSEYDKTKRETTDSGTT